MKENQERKKEISTLLDAAKEYVRRSLGIPLDLFPESLPIIDHYLDQSANVSPSIKELIIAAFGIYFGEVVRRRFDGKWVEEQSFHNPSQWKVVLLDGAILFYPTGVVAEALGSGPVEGWDGDIEVPERYISVLKKRLDWLGPVGEKQYYSLSVKMEALESLVEGIKDMGKQIPPKGI